jgi:PIN domain nuclease of toxin-antitoxin system
VAVFVTDTHPLLWYSTETYRKLSPKALRIFQKASRGEALIWIPAMAVWEAGLLEKIRRVQFRPSFAEWIDALAAQPGFAVAPLELDIVTSALDVRPNSDLFDTGIIATARFKDVPLITRDDLIVKSGAVTILW